MSAASKGRARREDENLHRLTNTVSRPFYRILPSCRLVGTAGDDVLFTASLRGYVGELTIGVVVLEIARQGSRA